MLRKGVYPYEYMDDGKQFNETSFPKNETFFVKVKVLLRIMSMWLGSVWKEFGEKTSLTSLKAFEAGLLKYQQRSCSFFNFFQHQD